MKTIYDMTVKELCAELKRHGGYVKEIKRILKKRNRGFVPPEPKQPNDGR
jgi:uncharacterized protein (UPF0335 family)